MDTLTKPKEKHSSHTLIGITEFTFISHYSMDECLAQLNALTTKYEKERRSFWKSKDCDLHIETLSDNGGVVHFEIKATANKQLIEVWLIGQLIYKDNSGIRVRTQTGITRQSMLWDIIINVAIWILFTLAYMSVSAFVVAGAIVALAQLITYASSVSMRSELLASVYEALQKPKAPRPNILPP